jgi:hypothetical protein
MRFLLAAELAEQVASNAQQQMIVLESRVPHKAVNDRQSCFRPIGPADGDSAVKFDDWRGRNGGELGVER